MKLCFFPLGRFAFWQKVQLILQQGNNGIKIITITDAGDKVSNKARCKQFGRPYERRKTQKRGLDYLCLWTDYCTSKIWYQTLLTIDAV